MNSAFESLLVPSSLLRLRQFMTKSGLKVRPWASAAETLEAFDALLVRKHPDREFWAAIERLLAELTRDLERRVANAPIAVQNELLRPSEHARLLAELKSKLAARSAPGFRRLAAELSPAALGVLCLVAGVALAGCGGATTSGGGSAAGGSEGDPTRGGAAALSGGVGTSFGGGSSGGTAAGGALSSGQGGSNAQGGNPASGGTTIFVPAFGGSTAGGVSGDPPDCQRELGDILKTCGVRDETRDYLVSCVGLLNDSWQTGIRELLECTSCAEVQRKLTCIEQTCSDSSLPEAFNLEAFVDNCVVVLYRGVAFE